MEEDVRFELTGPYSDPTVFKTVVIDRSTNLPF